MDADMDADMEVFDGVDWPGIDVQNSQKVSF